ncbi:NADH-quinone oxidoreductase subunit L [Candidatus Latescibacterota bacterium]
MNNLFIPIIVPLIAGAVILITPKALKGARELIALAGTLMAMVHSGSIFFSGKELADSWVWFSIQGFSFSADLRADSLSSLILFAASVFAVLIVIYSIGFMKGKSRLNEYYSYILLTAGGAAAAILADNLIFFLIGWEIVSILLFFLITIGGDDAREAAGKTFVIIGFSDCALLLGIVLLWHIMGTLQISRINAVGVNSVIMTVTYVLFLIGALVKAGAIPGHSWIPKASESAPASVMAYLPASLDKLLGIYLLARISLDMFALNQGLKLLLLIIGAVTIILAVLMALLQHNLKKLLAFHAVSQVGYMVMGIGTGVPIGIIGGLFHMINNAIYKCCLFLGAGAVEKNAGTTDLEELGGLSKAMPVTFIAMLISALAISGVPPLNGFASKWLIYQGTIEIGQPVFLLAAMFGSALTLASFVKVIYSVFLGQRPDKMKKVQAAGFAMALPMVVLAVLCVVFGVFAQWPLRYLIGPAVYMDFDQAPGMINLAAAMWSPTLATVLIVVSLLLGGLIYLLSTALKVRKTSMFVGGEKFGEDLSRYPGTGFYETIRDLSPMKIVYNDADKGVFDLYVLGGRYGSKLIELLRAVHNGVVSTYAAFVLVGLGFLILFLVR